MAVIGVPKETKQGEARVGLTPAAVRRLIDQGHGVVVETDAGCGSGFCNLTYKKAGAHVLASAKGVWSASDLVVKVKEPQVDEYPLLRSGQALFCYLHLAASTALTEALCASGCTAFAYETLVVDDFTPLLAPMSDIAGRVCVQRGSLFLPKLLSGVAGVPPAHVMIVGAGVVGRAAAETALGMGARVTLVDVKPHALLQARLAVGPTETLLVPKLEPEHLKDVDVLIGAVHSPGKRAVTIADRDTITSMKSGSLVIDVAIDQGGCFATSSPTSHALPTYQVSAVTHYCVPNLPAAVPVTATQALVNATEPYVRELAKNIDQSAPVAGHWISALNVRNGKLLTSI